MPIQTISKTYINSYRSDPSITWLIGNTGTWQTLRLLCEAETAIDFTTSASLFMEEPNIFTLTDGSTWLENGFDVGDNFTVQWTVTDVNTAASTTSTVTGQIVRLDGSTMYSNNSTLGGGALATNIYPTQLADKKYHSVRIVADKQPQSITFQYGHIKNSLVGSRNLSSFVDGSQTLFSVEDVDTMTFGQVKSFDFLGLQSGMSVAKCLLTYLTKIDEKYYYYIDVTFMISSFFDDVTVNTNASPDMTVGAECLTDGYNIKAYTTANNPNVFIESLDSSQQLGNTGYFDENYNGLKNDFTVVSVDYYNSSNTPVQQLDHANPVRVVAVIDGIDNLSGLTKCSYGFIWQPSDDTFYKSLPNPFYENTKINTGGGIQSTNDTFNVSNAIDTALRQGYSADNARMDARNVRFQQTGASQITFECEFVPTAEFTTLFNSLDVSERNYKIWVSVADQNEVVNKSNRVSLELDFNQMDTYIEPIGVFEDMTIGFLTHPQDETGTPSPCGSDIRIEDDLSARIEFLVDTATGPTIPIPTGLEYGILVERDSDGFQYKLETYTIDLTQYPNVQQYNFQANRGFKLGVGNSKNIVQATYYPAIDTGTKRGVLGLYGFKVRWEDWLARTNIPQVVRAAFYDNALEQNGLNNDWNRYQLVSGWTLYFYVFTNATLNGNAVRYENKKPLTFEDYDTNAEITSTFVYKRASDGTLLSGGTDPISGLPLGVILDNEDTLLEITWTRSVGIWADLLSTYGINTIEVDGGAGQFEYRQLSSIWGSESDNPLLPIAGATLLDLVLVSPTEIKASCLIDPSKLIDASRYKITGRIGCK